MIMSDFADIGSFLAKTLMIIAGLVIAGLVIAG